MRRLIVAAAALAAVCTAVAQDKVLRIVPHSNLNILDPIWTTQYMARNHGYMVYDTLFATDEKNRVSRRWWRSGARVRTIDCGPSRCGPGSRFTTGNPSPARMLSHRSSAGASATPWARS